MDPDGQEQPLSTNDPRAELRAAGALLGRGMAGIVGIAADAHGAMVDRVESALPAPARPVTGLTRTVAGGMFAAAEAAHRTVPEALAGAVAQTPLGEASITGTRAGRTVLPVLNGLWGGRIARDHAPLAIPMAVRAAGRDLPIGPAAVRDAFPQSRPHLVVFVHGLVEDDSAWTPPAGPDEEAASFGDLLERDLDVTSVLVRYNSGAHVSSNGEELAELIEELVAAWPVPVERISLVGHSMGGLVIRGACHAGSQRGHTWVDALATVVTLGTPHLGAPLEKAVHGLDWGLRRAAESAPYARVVGRRSVGIKDLRHGAILEDHWPDDEQLLSAAAAGTPPLPHVTHHLVASTLTPDPDHPMGRLVGDGMVRPTSAWASGLELAPDGGVSLGGVSHLALLHDRKVYGQLLEWVAAS